MTRSWTSWIVKLPSITPSVVMRLRMVSVGPTFQQFRRTVRDLSRANGKEARLRVEGGEVDVLVIVGVDAAAALKPHDRFFAQQHQELRRLHRRGRGWSQDFADVAEAIQTHIDNLVVYPPALETLFDRYGRHYQCYSDERNG